LPLAQLLHVGTFRGRLPGGTSRPVPWILLFELLLALMVLLIDFGVLNVTAMVILAFSRMTEMMALSLAVAVVWRQGLAAVLIVHEP
jgi:hypothetical protein